MSEPWKKGLLAAGWNLRTAVELAIEVEEMGKRLYGELAARWGSDPVLQGLFSQLASEEVSHQEALRVLLAGVGRQRSEAELDDVSLRAIAHASFFSSEGGALAGIERLSTRRQVLETVLKFERGSVLYFRGLRDVLGPSATLDSVIAEEKRHTASVKRAIEGCP
jgi:hypothetical protein